MSLSDRRNYRTQIHHQGEAVQYRGVRYHHHEVHALFEELIHKPWGVACWNPPVDVWENESVYIIEMDLPGVKADDVHVHIHDRALAIEGKRQVRQNADRNTARLHERCEGRFARTFEFDFSIEGQEIASEWRDGVLIVTVPKSKNR
ncbi:MAG: hypothetical protein A2Y77_12980 [Planctomycetes bacterium RBG_13_62_9]|nr:MAG: hypothetical protein A2Y77_12980 [Planctomycetes bacterium RBG_13_62_9]